MAGEFDIPLTPGEAIEEAKRIQIRAAELPDVAHKRVYLQVALSEIPSTLLIDRILRVSSLFVVAQPPDPFPGTLEKTEPAKNLLIDPGETADNVVFIGRAARWGYLYSTTDSMDSLTLNFSWPEVIVPEETHPDGFTPEVFKVPILAITSVEEAEGLAA